MQILIASATPYEIAPMLNWLDSNFQSESEFHFKKDTVEVNVLITGVGIAYTACTLGMVMSRQAYDLVINAGVAGAFNRSLKIGDTVHVVSERFGDLGVEEADGSFTSVHELGLIDPNQLPFQNGELINPDAGTFDFLPKCKGLTVHKVHGSQASIEAVLKKYGADVETMEGAAFFMACLLAEVSFLEIRAISNYVEPRNKDNWNLPLAIDNLNVVLIEIIAAL